MGPRTGAAPTNDKDREEESVEEVEKLGEERRRVKGIRGLWRLSLVRSHCRLLALFLFFG